MSVELLAVLLMIASGIAIAVVILIAITRARREGGPAATAALARDREHLAASILLRVLTLGGRGAVDAMRDIRARGLNGEATPDVDVANWGEAYLRAATPEQAEWLLDTAVSLIVAHEKRVPLQQYVALLDLSFALGFQTNALAKLRERYGFDYVDHARAGRPREADRAGAVTLFARDSRSIDELLQVLELEGRPSRRDITAAYRRVASQHHPDRFHDRDPEAQTAAAARFIEITRAYEALMAAHRD